MSIVPASSSEKNAFREKSLPRVLRGYSPNASANVLNSGDVFEGLLAERPSNARRAAACYGRTFGCGIQQVGGVFRRLSLRFFCKLHRMRRTRHETLRRAWPFEVKESSNARDFLNLSFVCCSDVRPCHLPTKVFSHPRAVLRPPLSANPAQGLSLNYGPRVAAERGGTIYAAG